MEGLRGSVDQYALVAWLVLLALVLLSLVWQFLLWRRQARALRLQRQLSRDADGLTILEALERYQADVRDLKLKADELFKQNRDLEARNQLSLKKIGLIRFNPFGDTGGDQSFALALLDDHDDGIVLSSLFGRSESRIFAKPVKNGQSKYALSTEEEQAICQASLMR